MRRTSPSVTNGAELPGSGDQALLFDHRYLLGDAVDAGRFTADGMREAIDDSLQALASPMGMALKDLLARDPTGEMLRMVERLEPAAAPAAHDGVWSSADGTRALILVQLRQDGTELDAQQAALATVQREFDAARRELGPAGRARGHRRRPLRRRVAQPDPRRRRAAVGYRHRADPAAARLRLPLPTAAAARHRPGCHRRARQHLRPCRWPSARCTASPSASASR